MSASAPSEAHCVTQRSVGLARGHEVVVGGFFATYSRRLVGYMASMVHNDKHKRLHPFYEVVLVVTCEV
jgi:hypothetical protein